VQPLIDGRAAMLAMARAFMSAKQYILLAGWDIRAELLMVRGEDARVGSDETAEQRAYVASLRTEGLDDEAIAFWNSHPLRVVDVLGFAAQRGAKVGVLLWDAFHMGSHLTNDPALEGEILARSGVDYLLDDSSRKITHLTQSLHQKCAVVDGRVAFVGGIDLTIQARGDFDRWDIHTHPCESPERSPERGTPAHPWHDAHARIEGPAVVDVLTNIVQRWREVAARHHKPEWPVSLDMTPPPAIHDGVPAQIVRTIPPQTYDFAPKGIATIKEAYIAALAQARRFVYVENQYIWPEVFVGLDRLAWGERSPDAMEVLEALAAALSRGVAVSIVLPDHPNCGRRFTDGGIAWLRQRAPSAAASGKLGVFTLGSSENDASLPGGVLYRPVYVHAKVMIVDDQWWTVGSANLNSRGMRSDAEINVVSLSPATARELRLSLWAEHLRISDANRVHLSDPHVALEVMSAAAEANRERIGRREHLAGHLLPYLSAGEPATATVNVHPEHGWLDVLEGGAGGHPAHYANRYL
jgi:phosphatidylserine/phosphatidylglycerophosphate/cardiolipin synthase-like enzyme